MADSDPLSLMLSLFYFTWDKQLTIDELIEMFNKFERFHIIRDNQRLIVE